MRRRRLSLPLAAIVLAAAAGCEPWYNRVPSPDDLMHAVPWFDHMIGSRAVHPYESAAIPRNTVPGTVPVGGAEGNWEAEFKSGNSTTADQLVNPLAAGAAGMLARGDTLYQTFCTVCHGDTGDGKGPVGPRLNAPSLVAPSASGRSDGYLYSIIRYGRGVMPRYGDKVYRPADRWAIVNYVRKLQADGRMDGQADTLPVATAAGGANR